MNMFRRAASAAFVSSGLLRWLKNPPLRALALLAVQMLAMGAAFAQSTTGAIFGQAPVAPGEAVLIQSDAGINREVAVDERGRYSATQLPLGTYTVTLRRDGAAVDTRRDIVLRVGAGTEVNFADASTVKLGTVNVVANALPPIDVTAVDSRTVITADQLAKLPLGQSAEAIALLAPGVVNNSGGFSSTTRLPSSAGGGNSLVSFGGSAPTENAYYINGFNTTDPLRSFGAGIELPYGAINQQEVLTGGYSAAYGRSDGGVINQVGKRGTDDWHFGFQVQWEPEAGRAAEENDYYASGTPPSAPAGRMYRPASEDTLDSTKYSAYLGGPIVKDTLFFFVAAEFQKQIGNTINAVDDSTNGPYDVKFNYRMPRYYANLAWNITDNQILEFTSASDQRLTSGTLFNYDYATLQRGSVANAADNTRSGGYLNSLKYTGYLTDTLTLSALYGKMKTFSYDVPASYDPSLTYVSGTLNQNPALNGGTAIGNDQTVSTLYDPQRGNRTSNLRLDLSWALSASHTLSAGIDNQTARAVNQGFDTSGPGYYWSYGVADPDSPISSLVPATGGFPNGAQGYYAVKNVYNTVASVSSNQRAQYVEDKWQVTDRLLLSLGLRNDQFTNDNSNGDPYIVEHKPQWAPRLGFAWDKNGDASFKIFGNAGRYYLGLPLAPALNAAAGYVSTQQYFTYGGIAADGTPTGLTQMSAPVSANNAFGQLPDPRTVAAQNIKPEDQDEFILGFNKQWGDWVYGAKGTFRVLRNAIDDYCDVQNVINKATSMGYTIASTNSCYLINPGRTNTFTLVDTSGHYVEVPLTNAEMGFDGLKRNYYALDLSLEHPFNGTYYLKFDYVFSRSYGNTEGQVRSDIGQSATSTSIDWDFPELMSYADGAQNNDHRHQFKLFGYYQIAPEWLVSANLSLISGAPKNCLGYYGPDQTDPDGYGSYYHWCNGQPSPPGSTGRMPWARQLDVGATYRPGFAANRLALSVNVFNVFNGQAPLNISPYLDTAPNALSPKYDTVLVRQMPRYVRFSLSYDF